MNNRHLTINCRGNLIEIDRPWVMGIVNLTENSFYDGGSYTTDKKIFDRIYQIVEEGVNIIDLGATTTRPGTPISNPQEEIDKLLPVIEHILDKYPSQLISIDTYHSSVAQSCLEAGAYIINDISGGTMDAQMFQTVAQYDAPYILMHIQGTPENMQNNPTYHNLIQDVIYQLAQQVGKAQQAGIQDIIIDPGFGFGKTTQHNFELMSKLESFHIFDKPILVGISRKSMIWKTLNATPQSTQTLIGTTALNMHALQKGALILRVHDVKEAVATIEMYLQINSI